MEDGTAGGEAVVGEASLEDDGVVASWLIVDDETSSELSELLDLVAASPPPIKVKFIDNPYSSPVIFQSSSAYVTINGNEESCGSSFSDSDSSVMASIDLGGAWQFARAEARGGFLTEEFGYGDASEDATWVKFLGEIVE